MLKSNPYFIAEISSNHCGSKSIAKRLIYAAKKYGANAVKLQTYTADTMTIKSNKKQFKIRTGIWKGKKLWDLYNKAHTPYEWHKELFEYSKKIGIVCFSTPFDESAVDLLESLNCPFYKIASFEMTDDNLIKRVAQTRKKMIISTGMATISEVDHAYDLANKFGAREIILMYCVSNYPSKISDFNMQNIDILKKRYKCKVGFSDHSLDSDVAVCAVMRGAEYIEKHIALDINKKSYDYKFSLKGKEILEFRYKINKAKTLLGKSFFYRNLSEKKSLQFRRSIYAVQNIKKNQLFDHSNIRIIRPGFGISPIYYNRMVNKKCPKSILKGQPITKFLYKKIK